MQTEEFLSVLLFGMMIGSVLTMAIQYYGRRKARQAVGTAELDAQRKMALLTNASDRQIGQIDRLQERLAVLEQIAIDPAHRTAREIEALR